MSCSSPPLPSLPVIPRLEASMSSAFPGLDMPASKDDEEGKPLATW